MKKLFAFLTALSLFAALCACNVPLPAAPEVSGSNSEITSDVLSFSPEEVAFATELATIYENYCLGRSYPEFYQDAQSSFAFGTLRTWGMAEELINPDFGAYDIDARILKNAAVTFLDAKDFYPGLTNYYSTDYSFTEVELVSADVYEENGLLKLVFDRFYDGISLESRAIYSFEAVEKQDNAAPEFHEKLEHLTRLVRLVSVENTDTDKFYVPPERVEISDAQGLLAAGRAINDGTGSTKTYILTADIDLSGTENFPPMGTNGTLLGYGDWRDKTLAGFNGVFDGGGHTVYGLKIDLPGSYDGAYAGMFANIGTDGYVKNLKISGADVRLSVNDPEHIQAGNAAGILAAYTSGRIENCHVIGGRVTGISQVGGLIGSASAYDTPESFIRSVSAENVVVTGWREVGGLIGNVHAISLSHAYVTGTVNAVRTDAYPDERPMSFGGFAGFSVLSRLENCVSSVEVKTLVSSDWVGSFLGYDQGEIAGCFYDGDLSSWKPVDSVYKRSYTYEDYELVGISHGDAVMKIKNIKLGFYDTV